MLAVEIQGRTTELSDSLSGKQASVCSGLYTAHSTGVFKVWGQHRAVLRLVLGVGGGIR